MPIFGTEGFTACKQWHVNKCSIIVLLLLDVVEDVEQIYKLYWQRANRSKESGKKVWWSEKRELEITTVEKGMRITYFPPSSIYSALSRTLFPGMCRHYIFPMVKTGWSLVGSWLYAMLPFFGNCCCCWFCFERNFLVDALFFARKLALFAALFMHTIQFNLSLVINKTMSTAEKYARISHITGGLEGCICVGVSMPLAKTDNESMRREKMMRSIEKMPTNGKWKNDVAKSVEKLRSWLCGYRKCKHASKKKLRAHIEVERKKISVAIEQRLKV